MINDEVAKALDETEQDHVVDLYDLDISQINEDGGDNHFYFCNELNELNEPVVWRKKKFTFLPISISGVESKSDGPSARPTLTIANINGVITAIIAQFNGLMSAKVTRYQVLSRHLDAVNFEGGNPDANPNLYVAQIYMINGSPSYDRDKATFQLAIPSETDGAKLPSRIVLAAVCPHKYRGECCMYDGHAVADENDRAIEPHEMEKDKCSKRLLGCQARFGINGQLPFGGFIMADKVGG